MADTLDKYDLVIGLEMHVQLKTESKLFISDKNNYGDEPNTNLGPITLAHPGTLPKLNKKAVEYAIKMGLACQCDIASVCTFDRKNYFYPDLPKGYQITQNQNPICKGGFVKIQTADGYRNVKLHQIHLEEDAGKSIHSNNAESSLIDYNRAGTPLIEMVTDPDIYSAEEAAQVLTSVRKMVRYLDIGVANMEEGSFRCDVNISLKLKGASELGQKVEIKNMNSIKNVQQAINFEIGRQSELLDKDLPIVQETRGYLDNEGITVDMRTKENANDYRYFPDPDLTPIRISEEWLASIKADQPRLHYALEEHLMTEFQLGIYDAQLIAETKEFAEYFLGITSKATHFKAAANWMIGPIKSYLNESSTDIKAFELSPATIAVVIDMVATAKLSFSMASTRLFPKLVASPNESPEKLAEQLGLIQDNDESNLKEAVAKILERNPDQVKAYQKGKKALLGMFMGEVMKETKGKANPKMASKVLGELLNK